MISARFAVAGLLAVSGCICVSPLSGEPWKRHTIDRSSRGADGVRLADVNDDGRLDIATGWEEGGKIRVYLHPGVENCKRPWPAVTVGSVKSPEDAVFVDLDGDGSTDVVSSCEGSNRTIFVHWAPRDKQKYLDANAWTTTPLPCTAKRQQWMFAVATELDGRRGVDLIVGSKGKDASIGWLESPDDPRRVDAWKWHKLRSAGWIMSLQLHDMNQDGRVDLLASDRKGPQRGVFWLGNPGSQRVRDGAAWREHKIGGHDREVMFLSRGLLDERKPAVVCAVRGRGLSVFRPTQWRQEVVPLPDHCGTGKGVSLGDIDLDGRVDLVFSCENAKASKSGVRWLTGAKDPGRWSDHEISGPEGVKFDRLELLDLDEDGDLDVLTCEERSNLGVIWYENPQR